MGNYLDLKGSNSLISGPIWPKIELVRDFMHVLVTNKYKKDRIKNNREKVETSFPHYKSMGAFCCHGNQSFDPTCPKTLRRLSLTPMMLHIKYDQDWPLASGIFKFKSVIFFHSRASNSLMSGLIRPNSNSTELLCLSRLPATLMMSRSKMNELAWRHHFPIISLWDFF